MMRPHIKHIIYFMVEFVISPTIYAETSFFEARYRGWLWFEEKEIEAKEEQRKQAIIAENARATIESLKIDMEQKRNIMIAKPTAENVKNYVAVEEIMWKRALALDDAYKEAKFLYPKYFDKIIEPQNIHAVKLKRKLEQENLQNKIKNFALNFDLVLFYKGSCPYCKEFAPILKRFSNLYNFKTEEVSIDGKMSNLFPGKIMPELAKKLGIESSPTIVAISKDKAYAFEMIRGYVTISELEEYASLAFDYTQKLISLKKGNNSEA